MRNPLYVFLDIFSRPDVVLFLRVHGMSGWVLPSSSEFPPLFLQRRQRSPIRSGVDPHLSMDASRRVESVEAGKGFWLIEWTRT